MTFCYRRPSDLVEALQQRAEGARAQLGEGLREPVARLMHEMARRHQLPTDQERMTTHALHLAETYLRTRPITEFESMTWAAFRNAILLYLVKLALQPFGEANGVTGGPAPLPECPVYQTRTLFLPCERLGKHGFGGDWFAGRHTADGALWVIVADVTGHGYSAYLLASALPAVWQACWEEVGPGPRQPAEVLAVMHRLLEDCLPEGVYTECTLARLGADGDVQVAPAGGTRLLLRQGDERPALFQLRGMWLGLSAPSPADQQGWALAQGDELLLGTDGVFDQLVQTGGNEALERLLDEIDGESLFETVERRLRHSLAQSPQRDDLTMVLLRRRTTVEDVAPSSLSPRTGDVRV
jgi:serine phosphatase RsbU (regulator of sigma subunit)